MTHAMTEPLVTIVVPAFRRVQYLPEALRSALAQTWRNFEIIVSDDGPTPEIERITKACEDPRLRYRHNGGNLGIAMNHYAAFCEARGLYIANLHDDDLLEPDFLSELVPALEADPEINVAFCDHHLIDEQGRFLNRLTNLNSRRYRRATLAPGRHQPFLEMAAAYETIPMAMGAVFRKSMLKGAPFPPQIGGCYDHWLAYLAVRNGEAIFYSPKRLTRYRIHAGSGSSTRGVQNLRNAIYVRSRFLEDPALTSSGKKYLRNALAVHYGKMALQLWQNDHRRRAWIVGKRAFSLMNRPKTVFGLIKNTAFRLLRGGTKGGVR
jgi:glycosyltransferase involved in cell wall biosynthesis